MHSHPSVLWWGLYSVSWAILDFTLGIHSVKWTAQTKANTEDTGTSCNTEGHLFSGSRKEEKVRERRKERWKGGRKGKKEGNLNVRFSVVKTTSPFSHVATVVCGSRCVPGVVRAPEMQQPTKQKKASAFMAFTSFWRLNIITLFLKINQKWHHQRRWIWYPQSVRPLFKASWYRASMEAAAPRTQEDKGDPHSLNHVGFPQVGQLD